MLEVEKNEVELSVIDCRPEYIKAFMKVLPSIIHTHRNEFALMRNGKIVRYYVTHGEAKKEGETFYSDDFYVIVHVKDTPFFTIRLNKQPASMIPIHYGSDGLIHEGLPLSALNEAVSKYNAVWEGEFSEAANAL